MDKFLITKIISKIKLHPLFYIVALITSLTGFFKEFSYIMIIIFVHELGHILTAIYFKWEIDKIVILPFGGITIFNEKINKSLKEELLIAINGPLIQVLVFSLIKNPLINKYHYFLLIFNLLPIIPLDGSKILNILFNFIFPFKLSQSLTIFISLIVVTSLLILKFNLILIIVILFLIFRIIKDYLNQKNTFNKFLIERYLYDLPIYKRKTIKGIKLDKMFRDYKHLFIYKNKYHSEHEILKKKFDINISL